MIAVLLPWAGRTKRFLVGDVEFLPHQDALTMLPSNERAALEAYASMYVDGTMVGNALSELRRLTRSSGAKNAESRIPVRDLPTIRHLEPLVVLVSHRSEVSRAFRAVDSLMFATVIENSVFYANSSTFRVDGYDLSRNVGDVTETRPRMHGRLLGSFNLESRFIVRPDHAEQYHAGANLEFASALLKAQERGGGRYITEALAALRLAMSDSPDVTQELQHSLFSKAATLVIWKRGLKNDNVTKLKHRVDSLLLPFFQGRRISGRPLRGPSWIRKAWIAVRLARNNFWHPKRRRGRSKFSQQNLVAPIMIALRVVYALILARLNEMRVLSKNSTLRSDVPAVAEWIASLGPNLENNLAVPRIRSGSDEDRRRWAIEQVAWNQAAEAANNWGRFRSEEKMQAGISETISRIKKERARRAKRDKKRKAKHARK